MASVPTHDPQIINIHLHPSEQLGVLPGQSHNATSIMGHSECHSLACGCLQCFLARCAAVSFAIILDFCVLCTACKATCGENSWLTEFNPIALRSHVVKLLTHEISAILHRSWHLVSNDTSFHGCSPGLWSSFLLHAL